MISSNCLFHEFVRKVEHVDYETLILLAEKEATDVERLLLQARSIAPHRGAACREYVDTLKALLLFLRSATNWNPRKMNLRLMFNLMKENCLRAGRPSLHPHPETPPVPWEAMDGCGRTRQTEIRNIG